MIIDIHKCLLIFNSYLSCSEGYICRLFKSRTALEEFAKCAHSMVRNQFGLQGCPSAQHTLASLNQCQRLPLTAAVKSEREELVCALERIAHHHYTIRRTLY